MNYCPFKYIAFHQQPFEIEYLCRALCGGTCHKCQTYSNLNEHGFLYFVCVCFALQKLHKAYVEWDRREGGGIEDIC